MSIGKQSIVLHYTYGLNKSIPKSHHKVNGNIDACEMSSEGEKSGGTLDNSQKNRLESENRRL